MGQVKFIFLCVIFSLTACSPHLVENDLFGKYIISTNTGTDVIELKSNGVYIHSHSIKDDSTQQQQDSWKLEILQAGPTVVLDNFQNLFEEKSGTQNSYTYLLLVQKNFWSIYLITNIDLNTGYQKQS